MLQIPYFVTYGQRFGRDFTELAAHFGAYLLAAWPHLPGRWAASTPPLVAGASYVVATQFASCRRSFAPASHALLMEALAAGTEFASRWMPSGPWYLPSA